MASNIDYEAAENLPAIDVYEKLNHYFRQQAIGKLMATMHHTDTKLLINGDLRAQGWIELDEFLKIMQFGEITMTFSINKDRVNLWCVIVDKDSLIN